MILFEKIDEMVLGKEIDEELTWFNKKSSGKKRKLGLIDPFQLVEKLTKNDLKDILKDLNTDEIPNTKRDLILTLYKTIHIFFDASKEIQAKYGNPIDYLGNILYDNPITRPYFQRFDVISLRELIEIFAEFSAELGFNVYDLSIGKIFPGDLFLTRKVPTPMNQIVLLVGAYDIVDKYDEIIAKIVLA